LSLLSITSKIFERRIHKHVYNFFHQNSVLTKIESGFVKGDSTIYQLIDLNHFFTSATDNSK
ncbi:hypothetical protein LOTGIDRAFT_130615, partial [Lottia gigantea]